MQGFYKLGMLCAACLKLVGGLGVLTISKPNYEDDRFGPPSNDNSVWPRGSLGDLIASVIQESLDRSGE